MSKGSKRRPTVISQTEAELRWLLALGKITETEYKERSGYEHKTNIGQVNSKDS